MERTPAWGIEPVPERLRVLGLLDNALLWGNLGVSLLVLVAGTYLVPALSLPEAVVAIVVGSLIGNAMLGVAGMIGADGRVPAMVLMRAPLGQRGSWGPTVINAAQCVGWSIFELLIIATAVAALSDEVLGFRAQWLWTLLFGGIALALGLLGPIDFVRKFVRKFAVWAVLASLVYLTWWALDGAGLGGLWDRDGEGGSSVLQGVDLVVAITVSWIPLAADYTRFSRTRAGAFLGSGGGYLLASIWLWLLGAILFFSRDITDPAALPGRGRGRRRGRHARAARRHRRRDRRGVRERLLDRRLDPEPRPAAAAAPARGRGLGRGDTRRAHDRPPLLPDLPAPPRLLLRPALRRAARGLARRRRALPRSRTSSEARRCDPA